ncbi:hypothetical protein Gpo141_00002691 [Globisporangium polare]
MSLVSNLADSIVEFIESTVSTMLDCFSFLETLLGRAGSSQPSTSLPAPDASDTVVTPRDPESPVTARMITSGLVQQLDTTTPEMPEGERMTQLLVAENAQLTRKHEQLQQVVADLSEYALRLERDVEISDCKATQLARELCHHRKLTTSALAMYHSARHQLAAAELRQSVALAYVDELVAKYGRRDDGVVNSCQARTSSRTAPSEAYELEEL